MKNTKITYGKTQRKFNEQMVLLVRRKLTTYLKTILRYCTKSLAQANMGVWAIKLAQLEKRYCLVSQEL